MANRWSHLAATFTCVAAVTLPAVTLPAKMGTAGSEASSDTSAPCAEPQGRPWCDASLTPDRRAALLLSAMTLDEKLGLMAGDDAIGAATASYDESAHVGTVNGVPRLGIPAVHLTDGPAGVRQGKSTALPAPMALGASFDVQAARRYGALAGDEAKRKGNDVIFGPAVDIMRTPLTGRSFETYGEDPYLAARLGVGWIGGAQEQGVLASVKHFPAYHQETNRFTVNAEVPPRALREIYLPPFEAAIREAHAGTLMCAYNKVNGDPSCGSEAMLDQILRGEWGFDGAVVSDYVFGAKDTAGSANAGLDQELPTGLFYSPLSLRLAMTLGQVSRATVDDRVRAILRTMFGGGVFDRAPYPNAPDSIDVTGHTRAAADFAEDGITLLKNDGVLPLRAPRSIAVIGSAADEYVSGGGSSQVPARLPVSPRDGITRRAGAGVTVTYDSGRIPALAAETARRADVAIVVAADARAESSDQSCLTLNCGDPKRGDQDGLIRAVAAANPRTVVVLETGGPVLTPWADQVKGIVEAWYPGEQGGTALARVLFGDVDPGGRLPVTFPVRADDAPTAGHPEQYPGVAGTAHYSEGVLVGYRHYDAKGIAPRFGFGTGLSYTTFASSDLVVRPDSVEVTVTNTGARRGIAVPQLYLGLADAPGALQPPWQLRGFTKITLDSGRSTRVRFAVTERDVSYWDAAAGRWRVTPGPYRVRISL
jgi:beta-glucosidase